jgi:glycosyltransferase involved in cell wall biosynthesis
VTRTVIHYSDSTAFGGTERAILRLASATDRAQWHPVLFHQSASSAALVDGARAAGVDVEEVPAVRGKRDVARFLALASAVRRWRAAVFHAHLHWPLAGKYGIGAAAVARVPAIVATAQLHVELDHAGFVDLQHRLMTSMVDRYIAVSHDVAGHLRRRFAVPAAKIGVVPNAVDVGEIDAAGGTPATHWPVLPGRRAALALARLEPEKGIAVLLEAAALLPDLDVVIAGTGSIHGALAASAARLGVTDRVHFLGHRTDPAALLARADLFVLPSLVEGFPLSVLEAMAAGVPVVATDIGGTREAVAHEQTGLLVPARDPVALAAAMRRVMDQPEEAAGRASLARDRVRSEFSAAAVAGRVMNVYESVLRSA